MNKNLINDLEELIDLGLENSNVVIPYKKGNSIRIKNYAIRESRKGYMIYDCETNKQVALTYFKTSAVAIAKSLVEGKNAISKIEELDLNLLKHFNDAMFFKNTIKTTKDPDIKWTRRVRLDIAIAKSKEIKQDLDRFIF